MCSATPPRQWAFIKCTFNNYIIMPPSKFGIVITVTRSGAAKRYRLNFWPSEYAPNSQWNVNGTGAASHGAGESAFISFNWNNFDCKLLLYKTSNVHLSEWATAVAFQTQIHKKQWISVCLLLQPGNCFVRSSSVVIGVVGFFLCNLFPCEILLVLQWLISQVVGSVLFIWCSKKIAIF